MQHSNQLLLLEVERVIEHMTRQIDGRTHGQIGRHRSLSTYLVIEKVIKVKSNNWNGKTPKHLRHGQSLAGNHTIVVTPLWK